MSQLADELLAKLDIIDVIGRYVSLKKAGSNFTGLCPFHNEKSPSFMVSQSKQIYKCFGCGAGGNSIRFIMDYEKVDFMDAVKELSDRYHFDYRSYLNKPEQGVQTKEIREKMKLMNKKTQQRFVEQLASNQKASDYLTIKRKLDKPTIEHFGLGYAPDSYQQLVEFLKTQGFAASDMAQSGIVREHNNEYHSFLRSRITFPIHDHLGTLIGFAGRVINPEDQPKYLNSTETILYEKSKVLYGLNRAKAHVKEFDCLVVVEGYLDVIGLHRIGAPIGVATCGTALTLDHIKLLKRHTQTIKLLFDQDNAGEQAFAKGLKLCLSQGIFPQIITIPGGHKDIDEFANAAGTREDVNSSSTDALGALIDSLTQKYPIDTPITRQQYSHILFEFIAEIEDVSLMQHYLTLIANKLDTTVSVLFASYKQRFKTRTTLKRAESAPKVKKPFQPIPEIAIQSLLFQDFIHDQGRVTPKVDLGLSLVFRIWELSDAEKISQIFEGASEELQTQFLETQLRWSKQLDGTSPDKQESVIISIVQTIIQSHRKLLLSRVAGGDESSMSLLDEIGKYIKG